MDETDNPEIYSTGDEIKSKPLPETRSVEMFERLCDDWDVAGTAVLRHPKGIGADDGRVPALQWHRA
jgi:hypothetical protein